MKSNLILSILFLAATAAGSLAAQEEGIEIEDLFTDDFEDSSSAVIHDPLEKINRGLFAFNDAVYTKLAKPFARAYAKAVPDRAQRGISNVFRNAKFPSRFAGNVLQGRFGEAGKETGKFILNTTIGIGGILRPSDAMPGLQTNPEDVGQAFASWGLGHGFYFVLPFIGPTSLRDFAGNYVDNAVEPIPESWSRIEDDRTRSVIRSVEIVNRLPAIMRLYDSMLQSSIDPYTSVRDAYAQIRAREVAR